MFPYKILFLDIDDTIVTTDGMIPSDLVLRAIQRISHEVMVCFSTARGIDDALPMAQVLGIERNFHIVENGAKIITPDGNIAFRHYVPSSEAQQILDVCKSVMLHVGFCSGNTWINQLSAPESDSISVISIISPTREDAEKIPVLLSKLPNSYSVAVSKHWEHPKWGLTLISHELATKGQGVRHIQSVTGTHASQCVAIGDGITDLTMFPYVGLKIAMANGDIELREAADYVTSSVKEDGVASAIIHHFLGGHL